MKPSAALARHRASIRRIVEAHNAHSPRIFGSVAAGLDGDQSDLDILVEPAPGMTLFDYVETAFTESTQGLSQVTAAIHNLDQTTQQSAAVSEENAAAATEMTRGIQQIRDAIATLTQLVGEKEKPDAARPEAKPEAHPKSRLTTRRGRAVAEVAGTGRN